MNKETFEQTLDLIRGQEKCGNITIETIEGLAVIPLDDIVSWEADSLLYDLNRDKATTITLGRDGMERWINDYAVAVVIDYLLNELKKAKNERLDLH